MTKRMIIPLIFGLAGCAILISLGVWQVQRLAWKEGILAEIAQEIAADPVPLPASLQPDEDRYLPVSLKGSYPGDEIHVLFSIKNVSSQIDPSQDADKQNFFKNIRYNPRLTQIAFWQRKDGEDIIERVCKRK